MLVLVNGEGSCMLAATSADVQGSKVGQLLQRKYTCTSRRSSSSSRGRWQQKVWRQQHLVWETG
jgi:hypothetical protein